MKSKIKKFKFQNIDLFYKRFYSIVDTSVNFDLVFRCPIETRGSFFGKIEFGNFTVYGIKNFFLNKTTLLRIDGKVNDSNEVSFKYSIPYLWLIIINNLMPLIFSFPLILFNFLLGSIVLIGTIIQIIWYIRQIEILKEKFMMIFKQ